jgi:hypothetical protein
MLATATGSDKNGGPDRKHLFTPAEPTTDQMTADEGRGALDVGADGRTLPAADVLTGRAFLTGKSGSGKSNTCSVVAEELLDRGFDLLVVDTDGEYHTLAETYDIVHAGAEGVAAVAVGPDDGERLARRALVGGEPVVLDVSGYDDPETARALVERVVAELFALEREHQKPFLLMVEELQEYLPQTGGGDDLAALLERVAKRGRKRGLGICGVSQRPSSVDKDFITQCDWLAWHRLTWQNDVDVVRRVLGSERAAAVQKLNPGEAFLMTDWDDTVEQVRFRRKRTRDAGATPGLEEYDDRTHRSDAGSTNTAGTGGRGGTASTDDGGVDPLSVGDAPTAGRGERRGEHATDERADVDGGDDPERDSGGRTATDDRRLPPPPARPATRDGVAGSILEFGELTLYLCRVCVYRLRRLRSS